MFIIRSGRKGLATIVAIDFHVLTIKREAVCSWNIFLKFLSNPFHHSINKINLLFIFKN